MILIQVQKQNVLMQICVFQVALGRVRVYADYHTYGTHTGCMMPALDCGQPPSTRIDGLLSTMMSP